MRSQFVSSLFEVCALHTKPLVRQPTHISTAAARCNTLQVTTSPAHSAVVHEIAVTSSSTGYEVGVMYSLAAETPAEQRLLWDDKVGRFMAEKHPSSINKATAMVKANTDHGYLT